MENCRLAYNGMVIPHSGHNAAVLVNSTVTWFQPRSRAVRAELGGSGALRGWKPCCQCDGDKDSNEVQAPTISVERAGRCTAARTLCSLSAQRNTQESQRQSCASSRPSFGRRRRRVPRRPQQLQQEYVARLLQQLLGTYQPSNWHFLCSRPLLLLALAAAAMVLAAATVVPKAPVVAPVVEQATSPMAKTTNKLPIRAWCELKLGAAF
eukprot:Skav228154  [mRNA]  locus=scaffold2683:501759:505872:- [translate_table: standard]